MSVTAAIHRVWETDGRLTALVSADRVMTGMKRLTATELAAGQDNPEPPFVSIEDNGTTERMRTTENTIEARTIRFYVYHSGAALLKSVLRLMDTAYNKLTATYDGGQIIDMRKQSDPQTQLDDGSWLATVDYTVRTVESV